MADRATASYGGPGCLTLLGVLFVGLKLGEVGAVAGWSWWWVLSPFWIQAAILLVILIVVSVAYYFLDR